MYDDDVLLDETATARDVMGGVPVSFLRKQRHFGEGPPFIKVGRRSVRYRVGSVRKWLAEREVRNTAEADQLPKQSPRRA